MGFDEMSEDKDAVIASLRSRLRLLEAVIGNFPGGILLTDKDLKVVLCNAQQRELLDYPEEFFTMGAPGLEEIFRFNASRGEYGLGDIETLVDSKMELVRKRLHHVFERTRPNGTVLEIRGTPVAEGGFVTSYTDVTEQRRHQTLVARLAHFDQLTGLPNRALFFERLEQALARVRRGEMIAVHYVDLDRFKPVNDTYGHEAGDLLLQAVAERLNNCVREVDTVARFGGDEFVILQANIASAKHAAVIAGRVIDAMGMTFELGSWRFDIGASLGIAMAPDHGIEAAALLAHADRALYECKRTGRGQFRIAGQEG